MRGGVLTTTSKEIRLKPKIETGSIDQSSSVLQFTMPNKSVQGYISIQDELGNLYDYRPIKIQLIGGSVFPDIGKQPLTNRHIGCWSRRGNRYRSEKKEEEAFKSSQQLASFLFTLFFSYTHPFSGSVTSLPSLPAYPDSPCVPHLPSVQSISLH